MQVSADGEWITLTTTAGALEQLRGATFGVVIEVCRDGEPVAAIRYWHPADPERWPDAWGPRGGSPDRTMTVHLRHHGPVAPSGDDLGRWSIRVRSDPLVALRDLHSDRYWQMDFVLHEVEPPAGETGASRRLFKFRE